MPYFKAYIEIWNAINDALTPEQGWKIFMACINNDKSTEQNGDPIFNDLFNLAVLNAEYDMEG